MAQAKLTDEVKTFIVQGLACFDSPSVVAKAVKDEFGAPKFNQQTGRPSFTMRGHDVEEFVGVVRRYGAEATGVRALVDAANAGPEIAAADIAQCCGTCLRAA